MQACANRRTCFEQTLPEDCENFLLLLAAILATNRLFPKFVRRNNLAP
jgi:hypothetical protein